MGRDFEGAVGIAVMFSFSARTRLVICLVIQVVSVILLAIPLRLIPDRRAAEMEGRAQLCEAIAICGSALIQIDNGQSGYLEDALKEINRRNKNVASLAICRSDGHCLAATPDHLESWVADKDYPIDRQVLVPLFTNGHHYWGDVQVRFEPIAPLGAFANFVSHPWTRLLAFVGGLSYLLFQLFLWQALGQLNPTKAVPKRVRSTLETLAGGLIVLDDRHNIALANQTFAEAVGCDPDELRGLPISRFNWSFASDTDSSFPWVDVMRFGERVSSRPVRLTGADGEVRTYMVNSSPIQQQGNEIRGALISFDDITDLETAKAELVVSKQAAEDANRAKSDFLARMSHEIRTPMNAVLGFADVLRRGFAANKDEERQYLNIIHASGEHLLVLINDILDLSKIESGKLQVENISYSPARIINQVMATLKGRAQEKGIQLETEYVGNVPATIKTDPVRLRQILTNLIGNSIKFTSQGGVRLQVHTDLKSSVLTARIIDTGVGIPADKLQTIFDPFSQADGSVTRKFGGTGLGLAISRRLSRALGGDVVAQSVLGQGSVFTVTINTGDISNVKMVTPESALKDFVQEERELSDIRPGLRILVADDGESNRRLLKLVLTRAGAKVAEAENGKLAVEQAIESSFDFILMDMQMPVMDGYHATSLLRSKGYTAPILALTADAMKGTEEKCLSAGCTAYLTKPLVISELMAKINDLDPLADDDSSPATKTMVLDKLPDGATQRNVNTQDDVTPTMAIDDVPVIGPQMRVSDKFEYNVSDALSETTQSHSKDRSVLVSSLPTDEDVEFCEIVEMFIERLSQKLKIMTDVSAESDLATLAAEAHWLKGSGGMAGFDAFSEPAKRLEQAAKAGRGEEAESILGEIIQLADRIQPPRAVVNA